jgi:hypothetical protein
MELSRFREPELIRQLISEGALINTLDNNAMSALHHVINDVHGGAWWGEDARRWRDLVDTITAPLTFGVYPKPNLFNDAPLHSQGNPLSLLLHFS